MVIPSRARSLASLPRVSTTPTQAAPRRSSSLTAALCPDQLAHITAVQ